MLLINKPDFTLVSDRRLVKAADVATVRTAEEVIAAAEADAARIREEAKVAFEKDLRTENLKSRCRSLNSSISRSRSWSP